MTNPPQESDASGIPPLRPYLHYLLENGAADHVKVKWGKGGPYVITMEGKKYPYKGGHDINKNLGGKMVNTYLMSNKSSNEKQILFRRIIIHKI